MVRVSIGLFRIQDSGDFRILDFNGVITLNPWNPEIPEIMDFMMMEFCSIAFLGESLDQPKPRSVPGPISVREDSFDLWDLTKDP